MSSSDASPPEPRPARPFIVRPTGGSNQAQPSPGPVQRISRPFIPRIAQAPQWVATVATTAPLATAPPPADTTDAAPGQGAAPGELSPSSVIEARLADAGPAPRDDALADRPVGTFGAGDAREISEIAALDTPGVRDEGQSKYAPAGAVSDAWADRPLAEDEVPARPAAGGQEASPDAFATAASSDEPLALLDAAAWPPVEAQLGEEAVAYDVSAELPAVVPGADIAARTTPPASQIGLPGQASTDHNVGASTDPGVSDAVTAARTSRVDTATTVASNDERGRSMAGPPFAGAVVPPAEAWPDDVWPDEREVAAAGDVSPLVHDTPAMLQDDLATDLAVATEGVAPGGPLPVPADHAGDVAPLGTDWRPADVSDAGETHSRAAAEPGDPPAPWDSAVAPTAATIDVGPSLVAQQTIAGTEETAATLADRLQQLAEQVRAGALPAANLTAADASAGMRDSEVLVALLGAVLKAGR